MQWLKRCHYGPWGWYTGETHKIILALTSLKLIQKSNKKVKVNLNRQWKKRSKNGVKRSKGTQVWTWPHIFCFHFLEAPSLEDVGSFFGLLKLQARSKVTLVAFVYLYFQMSPQIVCKVVMLFYFFGFSPLCVFICLLKCLA